MYTTSTAFLEALCEAGVSHIFANLGSDHPPIIESLAEGEINGRTLPKLITCPNEMVALSAAHGFAQASGRAQAVLVHVECGTQSLAGAVHNAANGRVPALIFAGVSPLTQEGEMKGTRNEYVQWIQDVFDQRGIVRGYMRYENEIRTGKNVKQVVLRAMQFANSDPKGPVYLVGAREVMEEEVSPVKVDVEEWQPVSACGIPPWDVTALVDDLLKATYPLVVTSYLGRKPSAVMELTRLCRRLGIGVLESVPKSVNFPADDPLYQGNTWSEPRQNVALEAADLVLILDSDVPWIPVLSKPSKTAKIYHIDVDPLKERRPLWYVPAKRAFRADVATALRQINEQVDRSTIDERRVEERRSHYEGLAKERRAALGECEREHAKSDVITAEYLTSRVRHHTDSDTIFLVEGVTNNKAMFDHLRPSRPGSVFTSGGGSLGWNGGAAIGIKMALPNKTVVSLTGDGTYMFTSPSAVHWMSRHYRTPFLHVVYNNRGWKAPKQATLSVHPEGYASRAEDLGATFDPPPDYAGIATAAGGAFGQIVRHPSEVDSALANAMKILRTQQRSVVLDVWLARF
ncbi:MAG TPA: thiamine pyrophosphate-requiring protein [Bryobacteraceae bacterium]|nr:thiamine pyrophosphate-requiring protein [Bryobacteraceae bacterium]